MCVAGAGGRYEEAVSDGWEVLESLRHQSTLRKFQEQHEKISFHFKRFGLRDAPVSVEAQRESGMQVSRAWLWA